MTSKFRINITSRLLLVVVLLTISACANRGVGPQGGPKDEKPPVIVKEMPENGSVNYTGKIFEVFFDEYIQLDKVTDNVLVSPPQQRPPEVRAIGKRLIVKFEQDLLDSTTYTIDFGSAICDNNEKNPIKGYTFSFSTGPQIDSMQIGGMVLNAEDLNPVGTVMVGIHSNLSDSAFQSQPFVRIAKTDANGNFLIKNVRESDYRIFALNDVSKDYQYQPGEALAIYDSIIHPALVLEITSDTIWHDTIAQRISDGEILYDTLTYIDTILTKQKTFYKPDSLVLIYFKENKVRQYITRVLRPERHLFTIYFNAPQDSMPHIESINGDWLEHAFCQPNATHDTINYWLTDSAVIAMDSLLVKIDYLKSDSVYQLRPQTDTMRVVYRAPRQTANQKNARSDEEQKIQITNNGSKKFDIYRPLTLRFALPISHFDSDSMHLYQISDTAKLALPLQIAADSVGMFLNIGEQWQPETKYMLEVDSAAIFDIFGKTNDKQSISFQTLSLDQYSTLIVKLEPYYENVIIQILSDKDAVVRELPALPEGTRFEYLKPTSYYLRAYIDANYDGKWTTGDWSLRQQPEPIFYFPQKLTLRANWEFEEAWDIYKVPIYKQKPSEIRKAVNTQKR